MGIKVQRLLCNTIDKGFLAKVKRKNKDG